MHIAIVTPSYFPVRGGSEQAVHEWARRLSRSHSVSIVTLNSAKAPRRESGATGAVIVRLPPLRIRFAGHFLRAVRVFACLRAIDRRKRIDVVHLAHVYEMGPGGMLFARLAGRPVVTTLLGWDTYDPLAPVPRHFAPVRRLIMNASSRVVAMSEHIADAAKRQGCAKRIDRIPHGTDMHGRASTVAIRSKHGISKTAPVCFSLQRLHPRKGLHLLLQTMPAVLAEFPDTVLIIGGTGPQRGELERMSDGLGLKGSVIFAGFIADDELPSYYEQADLFVLPTLYEAFGLVYVDALAKGLPVVTTATGGALDLIDDDNGVLVPPGETGALARAVTGALRVRWDRESIIRRSRQYEWDRIVGMYETLYRSVIDGESG